MIGFSEHSFYLLYSFYVVHCPVKGKSERCVPLSIYGWESKKDIYFLKKKLLREKFKNEIRNVKVKKTGDMEIVLKEMVLGIDFEESNQERFAMYCVGPFLDCLFTHIRNSFAHGNFSLYEKSKYLLLEDRNIKGCRFKMIIKKETLFDWIKIIEEGPKYDK